MDTDEAVRQQILEHLNPIVGFDLEEEFYSPVQSHACYNVVINGGTNGWLSLLLASPSAR